MTSTSMDIGRLGRVVRVERQRQELLQRDLARRAGVSRNTVTQLENGNIKYSKCVPAILAALNLDPSEFLVDPPDPEPAPGAAPPLAHLSDAQLGNEAIRLLAEMTARLAARPTATHVPPAGTPGVIEAATVGDRRPSTAR